ncbi:hypothetical protein [Clostridium phage DCp1]|uniref:Uncharacterized protein n=1 Tax=Clostridium phage DCp1 TaxID=2981543 RepID=A0A977R7X2_9CAUD|nr:hypothetical protein [Clostridium phage DCp1]
MVGGCIHFYFFPQWGGGNDVIISIEIDYNIYNLLTFIACTINGLML